ncbi:MAG: UDP-N-acetylglucosamine 2-epimerase [Bacteroidales bacterium]|nr:UDP-N-acetylglucosamine 2-epimerase [Bacteroidales bacterium]MDD4670884.1 UDP-N-acetylglucosamine 2-epimerase [Bacteroidales bacterium]
MIQPASFMEIINFEKNSRIVMTDSGGVQKEAFFFEGPCVILRPETEWVEIVEAEAGLFDEEVKFWKGKGYGFVRVRNAGLMCISRLCVYLHQ